MAAKLLNDASIATVTTLVDANFLNSVDATTGEISKITSANAKTYFGAGPAGGDLSGTYPNPTVAKLNAQLPAFYLSRVNHTGTQAPATILTDTNNRFVTDAQIAQWNTTGGAGTGANTFTGAQMVQFAGPVNTSQDGLILNNTGTALNGTSSQYAPRIHFKGAGYRTAAPAGSKVVEFVNELQPISGAGFGANLFWQVALDGAAFATVATLTDMGNFTTIGILAGSNYAEAGTSMRSGTGTTMNSTKNTIIGQNASGGNVNSTAVGSACNAGQGATVIGNDNFALAATVANCIVVTSGATNVKTTVGNCVILSPVSYISANGEGGVYIGRDVNVTCVSPASTSANQGVYIGKGVVHTGAANAAAVIIGRSNDGKDGLNPVLIGSGITTANGLQGAVVIGANASTLDTQSNTVVIGTAAKAYLDATYGSAGDGGVAIGRNTFSGSWRATAIGSYAQALAVSTNAIGYGSYVNQAHGMVMGRGGYMDKGGSTLFYCGNSANNRDFYFGAVAAAWNNPAMPTSGEIVDQSAALNAGTIVSRLWGISGRDANATPTLTNVRGGHIRLCGGMSTGTAQGGDVDLAVTLPGGASNNTENAETVAMKVFGLTTEIQVQKGGTYTSIPSAIFAINSILRGFLPPRMTSAQRTAIASPAVGLMVYQTDATEGVYVNKSTGWAMLA
jgi:hypothetical protein